MSKVENGSNVKVHYKGTLTDGKQFDSSYDRGETLPFEVGAGQMIKGFDAAVVGMEVGETKTVTIPSAEAYGERNEDALQEVPRNVFPPDFEFKTGEMVQGTAPTGQPIMAMIVEEKESTVVLDMNHPLAGKDLNFEIELMNIEQ